MSGWWPRPARRFEAGAQREPGAGRSCLVALGFRDYDAQVAALTVLQARREGLRNFSLFCNHITIIPTMKASSSIRLS